MAVQKSNQKSLGIQNYADFKKYFMPFWEKGQGESMMNSWNGQYRSWAVQFKNEMNSLAAKDQANTRASLDSMRSKTIAQRNALTNQIATMNRNLLAAKDSQTLYDRAKDKTGLKDYSSTVSSLSAQLAKLRADLAKLK